MQEYPKKGNQNINRIRRKPIHAQVINFLSILYIKRNSKQLFTTHAQKGVFSVVDFLQYQFPQLQHTLNLFDLHVVRIIDNLCHIRFLTCVQSMKIGFPVPGYGIIHMAKYVQLV